jgi:hypothetical protein
LRLREQFSFIGRLPEIETAFAGQLRHWAGELLAFAEGISSFDGAMAARRRIEAGWAKPPGALATELQELHSRVKARPDKSATEQARSFLVIAQERLESLRRSRRELEEKKANASRGRAAYKTYCDISEKALTSLYEQVEEEFAAFYRLINHDDEGEFKASWSRRMASSTSALTFTRRACSRLAPTTVRATRTAWVSACTWRS